MSFGRPDLLFWVIFGIFAVFLSLSSVVALNRFWIWKKGGRARLISQGSRIPPFWADLGWILIIQALLMLSKLAGARAILSHNSVEFIFYLKVFQKFIFCDRRVN